MSSSDSSSHTIQNNLVAYLDGELNESDTEQVETSLSTSPELRRDVEVLIRTWDMLDFLPDQSATEEFTQRTIQSAIMETTPENSENQSASTASRDWSSILSEVRFYLFWLVGMTLFSALGFLLTHKWTSSERDKLVQDLQVIKHLDRYESIQSLDFLRELQKRELFEHPADKSETTANSDSH